MPRLNPHRATRALLRQGGAKPVAAAAVLPTDAGAAAASIFKIPNLRSHQRAAVDAALGQRELLLVLPTGGGKSLCYQLPALLQPGVTLVVSPLLAIMEEQVSRLRARGVAAARVGGGGSEGRALERLREGRLKLLYVTPEKLCAEEGALRAALQQLMAQGGGGGVARLVVDEAQCVSEWGEFRPSYTALGALREALLPGVPLTAATALGTAEVRADILRLLCMPPVAGEEVELGVVAGVAAGAAADEVNPFKAERAAAAAAAAALEDGEEHEHEHERKHEDEHERDLEERPTVLVREVRVRDNLELKVLPRDDGTGAGGLSGVVQQVAAEAAVSAGGLVYSLTRGEAEALAQQLRSAGVAAGCYHGGLSAAKRRSEQRAWLRGRLAALVCTSAFGMGVDRADVRWVVHARAPPSLSAYVQQAGRAGRDGLPARCTLHWSEADAGFARSQGLGGGGGGGAPTDVARFAAEVIGGADARDALARHGFEL